MILASVSEYDTDNPEGAKGYSSQYINKKDVRWIALIIAVLALASIPVYGILKKNSDRTACKRNINGMYKAISLYAESYDGRFPPLYQTGENNSPYLENGKPIVWASVIAPLLPTNANFKCPACKDSEVTPINGKIVDKKSGPKEKVIDGISLTYGMFAAMSARPISDFADPTASILIAETANYGAENTYNPVPFKLNDGTEVPFDGFCIGWNTGNQEYINKESTLVTRLAFYGTANGNFDDDKITARHDSYIHAINVGGNLSFLKPGRAKVVPTSNTNARTWSVR